MKSYRKIIFYSLLVVAVLFIAFTGSVFLFRERIIKQFILEANKNLSTPIDIGEIDVSMFEDFPNLSIVFYDVYIEDSHPGKYPLLTAKTISFQLNPIEVWGGTYTIRGLHIRDAEATLKVDAKGVNNYTITKPAEGQANAITFQLANVQLRRIRFRYYSIPAEQDLKFTSESLSASIRSSSDLYTIDTDGEVTSEDLHIRKYSYFTNKS